MTTVMQIIHPSVCLLYFLGLFFYYIYIVLTLICQVDYDFKVNPLYISTPFHYLLTIGVACCAQYTTDDGWYRAIILHIDPSGYVGVLYVDYGNSEYVPPDR